MKLALVPIALAALLVAGCGGSSSSSSSPSPQDWADSLCSSITTWSNSVKSAGESLKSGSLTKGDLKKTGLTAAGYDQDRSFMLVEISGDELSFQTISRNGKTADSGIIRRAVSVNHARLECGGGEVIST